MKKLVLFKRLMFLIVLFLVVGDVFSQDCDFTITANTQPMSCPGNGQIMVNVSNMTGDFSDFRYSLSSATVNINNSTSNVFNGLSAGTYKVVVNAICTSSGNIIVSKTLQDVVINSTYVTPDLGLVQGDFTSSHQYGTVPSFMCSPTGQIQLRIQNGVFPYYVEIYKDNTYFRTDNFSERMYSGTASNMYNYKDYYTIENLPPGNYTFHVTDGCDYSLPFVTGSVSSLSDTYPLNSAYIFRDPPQISDNIVRFSILQGISSNNSYYYYGYTQAQGIASWWEYCVSTDGGNTFSVWSDVSADGIVQQTLNMPKLLRFIW
ncbi:MAG: hypothetical protein LBP67_09360 [Bacteroidales bacterium]|jgi:hypothetical protein|nr:hypothetical protein [Bacteroidales bacterium]